MTVYVPELLTGRATEGTAFKVFGPSGAAVGEVFAASADRSQWVRRSWRVSNATLSAAGVPARVRHNASALAIVVWANETGWGSREVRGNVGNIICVPSESDTGCCVRTRGHVLRAYWCGTAEAEARAEGVGRGIAAFWSLVRRRYPLAWDLFGRAALNAPEELYQGGWATNPPSSADLESIWRIVRTALEGLRGVDGFEVPDARRIDEPGETPGDASDGATDDPGSVEDEDGADGEGVSLWVAAVAATLLLAAER